MTNSVVDNTSNLRLQPQTTANQLHQHQHQHQHQHNCNETTKMDNTIVLSGIAPDTETGTGTGTNPTATTTTTTTTTTDADADAYTDAPFAVAVAVAVASNNSEVESQSQSQSESESLLLYRLPEDALCKVMSFLDARSLCDMRRLNRKFKGLASKNRAGWDHLCRDLWKDKIHVCRTARQTLESVGRHNNNSNSSNNNNNNNSNGESSSSTGTGTSSDGNEDSGDSESAMAAFRMSLLDVRDRYHVTREELIFDPETGKGTVWSFRFKEAAGSDWTTFDPWYNYQPCRKMVFLENGEVKIYVARQKAGEGGEQHGQPQIQPQAQAQAQTGTMNPGQAGTIGRSNNNNNNNNDGNSGGGGPSETGDSARQHPALPEQDPRHYRVRVPTESGANASGFDLRGPAVPMTWRFVTQPLDFPDRPVGSYVRFSLSGREVPTYVCRRSPTNNWGFVMESCWGVYASFELPPRPRGDDSSRFFRRRRRRQRRLRRALNRVQGRVDADVDAEDSSDDENDLNDDDNDDDDDDDDDNDERGEDPTGEDSLLWDDNFHVTTESQWREAFLYNNFTFAVLPDGSGALAEFQRNYGI